MLFYISDPYNYIRFQEHIGRPLKHYNGQRRIQYSKFVMRQQNATLPSLCVARRLSSLADRDDVSTFLKTEQSYIVKREFLLRNVIVHSLSNLL